MEWFIDDPRRGETALGVMVLALAAVIIWLGRRRLSASVPVALVFLLLAAMGGPSAIPARAMAQRAACIVNLRMIQNAKAEWARENNKTAAEIPTEQDLCGTNKIFRHWPSCPRGGTYMIWGVSQNATCSFSNKGHRVEGKRKD